MGREKKEKAEPSLVRSKSYHQKPTVLNRLANRNEMTCGALNISLTFNESSHYNNLWELGMLEEINLITPLKQEY